MVEIVFAVSALILMFLTIVSIIGAVAWLWKVSWDDYKITKQKRVFVVSADITLFLLLLAVCVASSIILGAQ